MKKSVWKWIVWGCHWFSTLSPILLAILLFEMAVHLNGDAAGVGLLAGCMLVIGSQILADEFKGRRRYYELIGITGVIGVCSPTKDEELAGVIKEDYIKALGAISRKQFESFGDHPWDRPISRKRYVVRVKNAVVMERTKFRCPSGDPGMEREE